MLTLSQLPALNACLNFTCAVFLITGFYFVKRGRVSAHRACMAAAFVVSCLFLTSYLYYHAHAGSTRFTAQGWIRPVYFLILITHTVLATAIVPLILTTLWRAWRGQFDRHRRLARWTWPLWMYVSLTGVVIYLLLYQVYPAQAVPTAKAGAGEIYFTSYDGQIYTSQEKK